MIFQGVQNKYVNIEDLLLAELVLIFYAVLGVGTEQRRACTDQDDQDDHVGKAYQHNGPV